MKQVGPALWLVGLALFVYAAFIFEPSVSTHSSAYLPSRVVNLDLQQRQLLLAMAGLTLFLAGVIVHALGELAEARSAGATKGAPAPSHPAVQKQAETLAEAELRARHGIQPGDDGAQV